ncbi:uncharacterized protein DSM5745_06856 [Aspergillus mulundensis]|uniref:Uncharacterized protein n=1 Tax=Aspergillus mulundensis TaxID=1810919 RepID=A0A3D8RSL3_9EURO|nr:Uncharacterized protein DSM5745_06856 [Aspergillus mulundensis]RDW76864.1 Uncharacterized protein DSM5745_06856 [Aspergillus mulundensis]
MESTGFTFLNSTGASLPGPAAKRMRAHITRTNFAKRRQRIAATGASIKPDVKRTRTGRNEAEDEDRGVAPPPTLTRTATDIAAFHKIQELVFLEGRHTAGSASEAAWFNLIASEPALVEASLAVAVRQWSPDNTWQSKADYHSYTAVRLIKQRITSITTPSDGVLGAVITMALGASLGHDEIAWKIHMDGLAHIVQERVARDPQSLPSWFVDLIIQDSINNIFEFPRVWHPRIVEILGESHDRRILKLAEICDSVTEVRKTISSFHESPSDVAIAQEIEEPLARLHYEARNLRAPDNLHIDAAARAIELVLYLLRPTQSSAHLALLAAELKEVISRFPIKGCTYMDLTSFQLMIGAIAADRASPVRTWFVEKILKPVRWMQERGWRAPLSIVETVGSDPGDTLVGRLSALWKELYDLGDHKTINKDSQNGGMMPDHRQPVVEVTTVPQEIDSAPSN